MRRYSINVLLHGVLILSTLLPVRAASDDPIAAAFERSGYTEFEHISVGVEAPFVLGMLQDRAGLMWICTHKGLYSYDGYRATPHPCSDIPTQTHCAIQIGERIWTGTDHGVRIYDLPSGQYVVNKTVAESSPNSVRALLQSGGNVWIGHARGLLRYETERDRIEQVALSGKTDRPLGVYCIHEDESGLYVGTFDGLYRLDPESGKFRRIGAQPYSRQKGPGRLFVYAICRDDERKCLWIGTQHGLWRYDPRQECLAQEMELPNTVINSIAIDRNGAVVIGSDAGLFIRNGSLMQHITHDARNRASLADDDIESLLTDRDGNLWIGTHNGISLARSRQAWETVPLHLFTQSGRGLFPSSMLKDRSGGLWLGGTNGIVHIRKTGEVEQHHIHSPRHPLPHNSIHTFYEDRDGAIWAATDGGAIRYDRASGRFAAFPVRTELYNAQWCYALAETDDGRLWTGTFSSGIFIFDKRRILANRGGAPDALLRSEIGNGSVSRMKADPQGTIWVLYYDRGIDRIAADGRVDHVDLTPYIGTEIIPSDMAVDDEGFVWAGFPGGALRIDSRSGQTLRIDFSDWHDGEILAIGTMPDAVWFSTTDGLVWSIDRKTLKTMLIPLPVRQYPSLCYDVCQQAMLLGCSDAVMRVKLPLPQTPHPARRPVLTGMTVDGEPFRPTDRNGTPYSIDYATKITLRNPENKFSIYFSAMNFAPEGSDKYAYRMEPTQEEWAALTSGVSSVSFLNLPPGSYRFSVCRLDASGTLPGPNEKNAVRRLDIVIRPPLYASTAAWVLYSLILTGVAAYVVYSVRLRIRLRQMRFEKETLLAQSSAKVSFLADISHDLKTPLSLIIGPVSQIMLNVRDKALHAQLDSIRRNAERINALVCQILDFKSGEEEKDQCIRSTVDLKEVFRQVVARYGQQADIRRIRTSLRIGEGRLFYSCDLHKIESALDNLLSNAYKYVPDGGAVEAALDTDPESGKILIRIADNGIGIPENEQPYIFQRFFQSSLTRDRKEGTGIGLYLVHKYVAMHGGSVRAVSREGAGSLFTIELPPQGSSLPEVAAENGVGGGEEPNRPKILIAEDDPELSRYIADALNGFAVTHTVPNGQQALAFFHREAPDLMITDLMMPGMDGMELCRRIRSEECGRRLPIVMLTARADARTETESLKINIDAFIAKPFDITRLVLRVRQLICTRAGNEMNRRVEAAQDGDPSPDELFLSEVTTFIENAIDSPDLNVAQIAEATGVSAKQLYRKLKALTGYTPVDYIRSIRIKRAAMMLASGRFTVGETMYSVGFSDSSYFARCFRAEFGCTPSQYRKEQEQKC